MTDTATQLPAYLQETYELLVGLGGGVAAYDLAQHFGLPTNTVLVRLLVLEAEGLALRNPRDHRGYTIWDPL